MGIGAHQSARMISDTWLTPSVLAAYGAYDAERLRDCDLPGTYVQWRSASEPVQLELFTSWERAA